MPAEILKKVWPEWSLEERIGAGAYGTVYKVVRKDYGVESYGAIKMVSIPASDAEMDSLRAEGLDEQAVIDHFETIVNEFVNEIRVMVSLEGSPNIVNVKDYRVVKRENRFGWDILILMELLTPLSEYICSKSLTEQEVIKLGCDICTALETCQQEKIIHRDVKPGNIMVHTKSGAFKLGDFGIARKLENMSTGLSQRYTPKYMAPEVTTNPYYDARVDIYSLGVVLYQLLNEMRIPFQESQRINSIRDIETAIKRRTAGEALPKPVEASEAMASVILKACAFDPAQRFATAGEMKAALMNVANGKYRPVPIVEPDRTVAVFSKEEPDKTVAVRRAPQREAEEPYDDYEEDRHRSPNTVLAIVAVLLTVALMIIVAIFFIPKLFHEPEKEQPVHTTQSSQLVRVPCIGLELSQKEIELDQIGQSHLIHVTQEPANTTDQLTFTSSDESVAVVGDYGLITGMGSGDATIFVTCGNVTEKIQVHCKEQIIHTTPGATTSAQIPCTDLEVSDVDIYREDLNGVWQLIVTPVPANTTDEIEFLSTDQSVVQVSDSGRVTAVNFGRASVLVICGSLTKEIPVTFFLTEEDNDEEFVLTLRSKDFTLTKVGARYNLYDGEVDASDIVWSTDHAEVVTITNGIVTAVGNGRTRVYGEYGDQKVSCWVSVQLPDEDSTTREPYRMLINGRLRPPADEYNAAIILHVGERCELTVEELIFDGQYEPLQNISWSASREGICSIAGDVVTAEAPGQVEVTAIVDGYIFTCTCTVMS